MDDFNKFGELISGRRASLGMSLVKGAKEISVHFATLEQWETGFCFPREERLSLIARVYQTDLSELKEVWLLSKAAKKVQNSNKRPRARGKSLHDNFAGSIGNRREIIWGNRQVSNFRFGRR